MRLLLTLVALLLISGSVNSQSSLNKFLKPSDSLNITRRNAVIASEVALASLTLISLDRLWYADYERSHFKTINDSNEWLQMDKLGHVFSSYQIGRFGANSLNWAGVSKRDQLLYGATLGLGFLTAVEIMDGFSEGWGFSWSDMAANTLGAGIYIGQELLWEEQRISLKYSFHRTSFAQQRPDVLGNGFYEELLKDYNGQTYWLSANLESFFDADFFPNWLNLAIGYSGEGMLTGAPKDQSFPNQNRVKQYFLSLDVDLSRIKTNSNFLRTVFDILNVIKVPFPTLEYKSTGVFKWHFLYF